MLEDLFRSFWANDSNPNFPNLETNRFSHPLVFHIRMRTGAIRRHQKHRRLVDLLHVSFTTDFDETQIDCFVSTTDIRNIQVYFLIQKIFFFNEENEISAEKLLKNLYIIKFTKSHLVFLGLFVSTVILLKTSGSTWTCLSNATIGG